MAPSEHRLSSCFPPDVGKSVDGPVPATPSYGKDPTPAPGLWAAITPGEEGLLFFLAPNVIASLDFGDWFYGLCCLSAEIRKTPEGDEPQAGLLLTLKGQVAEGKGAGLTCLPHLGHSIGTVIAQRGTGVCQMGPWLSDGRGSLRLWDLPLLSAGSHWTGLGW